MMLNIHPNISHETVIALAEKLGCTIVQTDPAANWWEMLPANTQENARQHRNHAYTIAQCAKFFGIGTISLFQELRKRQILNNENLPNREYMQQGLFVVEHKEHPSPIGPKPYAQTLVTSKGYHWLRQLLITNTQEAANP